MRDEYEDGYDDDDDQPDLPWPPLPPPPPPPSRGSWTHKGFLVAGTAVIAAAAGFLVVTAVRDVSASPPPSPAAASAAPSGSPQDGLPSAGSGSGTGPLPTPGSGETLHLEIGGKVTAVSATSITLSGGAGQQVTAAVTGTTAVTGKVHAISGVKVGDMVSAQITGTDGKLTATAVQDPASIP